MVALFLTHYNMKVTLNIEQDKELRDYIKDCISGQVKKIVREELMTLVVEEINKKVKGLDKPHFDNEFRICMVASIGKELQKNHNIPGWEQKWVKPIVESIVEKYIKDYNWNLLIDDLAKEKVRKLIK